MLFHTPYTTHSYTDFVVNDTGQTAYSFTKQAMLSTHIKVYYKSVASDNTWTLQDTSKYTISGSTGAWTITLGGSFPARTNGDTIRIRRETPDTLSGRLVDFQAGSIREADLDSAAIQNLYVAEERRDEIFAMITVLTTWVPTVFGVGYTWQSV